VDDGGAGFIESGRDDYEGVKFMAYSDFSLEDLEVKFGVKNRLQRLFGEVQPITPSTRLQESLQLATELPVRSEKAKSEAIVFPVLVELRNRNDKYFTIYSGDMLNADESRGLIGECDFILAKDINSYSINYPIFQVVEAKKHDIELGIPQCAAQLVGAQLFNEKKGIQLERIYGCVTTGDEWLFMKLEQDLVIDTHKYYIVEITTLLGILQEIIDFYRVTLK
jgi:hypothetical protein